MTMLSCDKSNLKWLAPAILLLLSACPLRAQTWDDDEMKKKRDDCPPGFTWTGRAERFLSGTDLDNPNDAWRKTRGPDSTTGATSQTDSTSGAAKPIDLSSAIAKLIRGNGMPMRLGKEYPQNDIALESISHWRPPVYAAVQFSSTGAPGIPSTFNFRRQSLPDDRPRKPRLPEIDLIVASVKTEEGVIKHFMSTPVYAWDASAEGGHRRLRTLGSDAEVKIELGHDTTYATNISAHSKTFAGSGDKAEEESYFDQNWGITWEGFDPTKETSRYGIKWLPESIQFFAADDGQPMPLRLTINKATKALGVFPNEPLPITFGPWEAENDWAGAVDWTAYANPTMTTYRVEVYGCVDQKDLD